MKKNYKYKISYFVPCLNEEDNIIDTLENLKYVIEKTQIESEVIIVDDNSVDDSIKKIENFKDNTNLNITLVKNNITKGLGLNYVDSAFIAEGEYYMLVNGDNAEPKDSILSIVSLLGQADIIIPFFKNNDSRNLSRVVISKIFTFVTDLCRSGRFWHARAGSSRDFRAAGEECWGISINSREISRNLEEF